MHIKHRSLCLYCSVIVFVYFVFVQHSFAVSIKSLDLLYTGSIITNRNNFGPYHEAGISTTLSVRETPLIAQLNGQHRSYPDTSLTDMQVKLDIWPILWDHSYANIMIAYSPEILSDPLYPDYQFLSELYFTRLINSELSLGAKISFYQDATPLSLTASWSIITDVNTLQTRIFCLPFKSAIEVSGNIQYNRMIITDKLIIGAGAGGGTQSSDYLEKIQYRHLLLINAKLYGKYHFSKNSSIIVTPVYSYEEYLPERFTSKIDVQLIITLGYQK